MGLGNGGTEQKGERTHGHGQACGDCRGVGCIRGMNGNGKNTIKLKINTFTICNMYMMQLRSYISLVLG